MFTACGVITITTDFGHQGPFVATMKGRILAHLPAARIIDVTHEVPVYWPAEAGFWLARAYSYFPNGSVHVAVVDPGVGTARDIIVVAAGGHAFLAPDNGLLAPVVARSNSPAIFRLDTAEGDRALQAARAERNLPRSRHLRADRGGAGGRSRRTGGTGAEDHGYRAVVGRRAGGHAGPGLRRHHHDRPLRQPDHQHRRGPDPRASPAPVVRTGGHSLPLRRTYGDVRPGEFLALVNSFGVIEIARAEQSAAEALGPRTRRPRDHFRPLTTRQAPPARSLVELW